MRAEELDSAEGYGGSDWVERFWGGHHRLGPGRSLEVGCGAAWGSQMKGRGRGRGKGEISYFGTIASSRQFL